MRIRNLLKPIMNRILPPVTRWYLRKERSSRYKNIDLRIPPGVFHPGLYFSTRFLLSQLEKLEMEGKSVLELGAGSGMISIRCAKRGAEVTATDISGLAVKTVSANALRNEVSIEILQSDLFESLPAKRYDLIIINPPYYPGIPKDEEGHAWYCGPEFEYFVRLFEGLAAYVSPESKVLMVLSEDCEIERIREIAAKAQWNMEDFAVKRRYGEWNYIFELGFGD